MEIMGDLSKEGPRKPGNRVNEKRTEWQRDRELIHRKP